MQNTFAPLLLFLFIYHWVVHEDSQQWWPACDLPAWRSSPLNADRFLLFATRQTAEGERQAEHKLRGWASTVRHLRQQWMAKESWQEAERQFVSKQREPGKMVQGRSWWVGVWVQNATDKTCLGGQHMLEVKGYWDLKGVGDALRLQAESR